MKITQYIVMLITIVGFANNVVLAEESNGIVHDQSTHQIQEPPTDWPGIYLGFIPCADCIGINTTLALNKNNSYVLVTQYVKKSDREFVEKGRYTWDKDSQKITLIPKNGSGQSQQYSVGENTLTQLDSKGMFISGKLAQKYVLHRKDVTKKPQDQHAGH